MGVPIASSSTLPHAHRAVLHVLGGSAIRSFCAYPLDAQLVAVLDVAGRVGVRVPDGLALAVFVPRALDLVGGRGDAPVEPSGEAAAAGSGRLVCTGVHPCTSALSMFDRHRITSC